MPARRLAALAVLALSVAAACADSKFLPNDEDSRRLDLLHADPAYAVVRAATRGCEEALAHYRPASGEPLDLAAVEPTRVRCSGSAAAADSAATVLDGAEAAGWLPVVDVGSFAFPKRLDGVRATLVVDSAYGNISARLEAPPHGGRNVPPSTYQLDKSRACLTAARAHQPPSPDCPLTT